MFSLEDFIRESNRIEGIHREPLPSEVKAHENFLAREDITVGALKQFVFEVAGATIRDKFGMDVRVGNHYPMGGGQEVVEELRHILVGAMNAFEQHVAYETLHPFTDGNGRSGRALWLHRMHSSHGCVPLGFLHTFYYQTLANGRLK